MIYAELLQSIEEIRDNVGFIADGQCEDIEDIVILRCGEYPVYIFIPYDGQMHTECLLSPGTIGPVYAFMIDASVHPVHFHGKAFIPLYEIALRSGHSDLEGPPASMTDRKLRRLIQEHVIFFLPVCHNVGNTVPVIFVSWDGNPSHKVFFNIIRQ